jgi:hypothetical protein
MPRKLHILKCLVLLAGRQAFEPPVEHFFYVSSNPLSYRSWIELPVEHLRNASARWLSTELETPEPPGAVSPENNRLTSKSCSPDTVATHAFN